MEAILQTFRDIDNPCSNGGLGGFISQFKDILQKFAANFPKNWISTYTQYIVLRERFGIAHWF